MKRKMSAIGGSALGGKKILVTGGFGFIGSTLVEILAQDKKNRVHVVDDMSTSPLDVEDFLETIGNPGNLTHSVSTVEKFFTAGKIGRWDQIYHLASPVGPAGVLRHAGSMIQSVVRDGYLIMDYCLKKKAKLLDVSTNELYGGGQDGYCDETMPKIISARTTVRLEYAIAKLAMETAIINTVKKRGLKAIIVRPFNVAGKRQSVKGGFVLPRFIQQAHKGEPLTVFAGGEGVRTFTNVKDMAAGIILAMEKGRYGEAYNMGNPANKLKIFELAKKVKKIMRSKSEIHFVDPKKIFGEYYEEASDKFPEISKARTELGFDPRFGVEKTIREARDEYFRQLKKGILKDKI